MDPLNPFEQMAEDHRVDSAVFVSCPQWKEAITKHGGKLPPGHAPKHRYWAFFGLEWKDVDEQTETWLKLQNERFV
jgi:hypothetical protein